MRAPSPRRQSLLAVAESGPLSDVQHARTDLLHARLAFVTDRGNDAPPLLLKAARRLQPVDTPLCRATYLDAMEAAFFVGRLASGAGYLDVARAARNGTHSNTARVRPISFSTVSSRISSTAMRPGCRFCAVLFVPPATGSTPDDEPEFMVAVAATHIWDDEGLDVITARHVELARAAGARTQLPLALSARARNLLYTGDLAAAEAVIHEAQTVTRATGDRFATSAVMAVLGFRGDEAGLSALIEANTNDVMKRGEGSWLTVAEYAGALLNNGIGNHAAALALAQRAAEQPDLATPPRAAVELVEAAARCGAAAVATQALTKLAETTTAAGTDWALGVEARSRGPACRRACGGTSLSPGDRAVRPDPHADRSRAGAFALRGMAATGTTPNRRAGTAP